MLRDHRSACPSWTGRRLEASLERFVGKVRLAPTYMVEPQRRGSGRTTSCRAPRGGSATVRSGDEVFTSRGARSEAAMRRRAASLRAISASSAPITPRDTSRSISVGSAPCRTRRPVHARRSLRWPPATAATKRRKRRSPVRQGERRSRALSTASPSIVPIHRTLPIAGLSKTGVGIDVLDRARKPRWKADSSSCDIWARLRSAFKGRPAAIEAIRPARARQSAQRSRRPRRPCDRSLKPCRKAMAAISSIDRVG